MKNKMQQIVFTLFTLIYLGIAQVQDSFELYDNAFLDRHRIYAMGDMGDAVDPLAARQWWPGVMAKPASCLWHGG